MKLKVLLISSVLVLLPAVVLAHASDHKDKVRAQKIERTVPTDSAVTVSLCVMSGSVTVRGWDKNEVLARSSDVSQIELKRVDATNQSGPATRLTVLMVDRGDGNKETNDCQAFGDVELMVPRGASIYVHTGEGDINIFEVASVYARSQSGDISVEGASRSVEAVSFSSDVSIKDSTGRVAMKSVGGSVTATNLRPNDSDDPVAVSSISGDIELDRVAHAQISARTVNGTVNFAGPLAHGGQYSFNTTTGDVTLALPPDASFRLNARVSQEAAITSDFPLTLKTEKSITTVPSKVSSEASDRASTKGAPTQPVSSAASEPLIVKVEPKVMIKVDPVVVKAMYMSKRVTAVHGTGDASITVVSFSGSLHLQKD